MSDQKHSLSYLQISLIAAVIGGLGTILLTTEKGRKVLKSLEALGDEVVDVVEGVIEKVDKNHYPHEQARFEAFSNLLLTTVHELGALKNKAVETVASSPLLTSSQPVQSRAVAALEMDEVLEGEIQDEDELTNRIALLHKSAKKISKKSF